MGDPRAPTRPDPLSIIEPILHPFRDSIPLIAPQNILAAACANGQGAPAPSRRHRARLYRWADTRIGDGLGAPSGILCRRARASRRAPPAVRRPARAVRRPGVARPGNR